MQLASLAYLLNRNNNNNEITDVDFAYTVTQVKELQIGIVISSLK